MGKLANLDRAIIERAVEPVAHRIEHLTGVSNFMQARGVLVLYPAVFITIAMNNQGALDLFMAVIVVIVATMRFFILGWNESARSRRAGFANPDKIRPFEIFMRNMFLSLVTLDMLILSFMPAIAFGGFLMSQYFGACDQPPPRKERQPLFGKTAMETG